MEGTALAIYLIATFAAAVVTGVSGFAFGLIAAGVWLHILTPLQTASLIIAFGLVVQGISVWKLRRSVRWARLWPFLAGGAFGVPAGVAILGWASAEHVRLVVGAMLVLYSLYGISRPETRAGERAGRAADTSIGVLNGLVGGLTGLAGIVATIWCSMRGWTKDEQRAVFQPTGLAVFAMSAFWLGLSGAISGDIVWLFLIGIPALMAGTWLGLVIYGRLDDAAFRIMVLMLLFFSGIALVGPIAATFFS